MSGFVSYQKPKAILVDFDQTLCLIGDRDPYDGEQCRNDQACPAVKLVVQSVHAASLMDGYDHIKTIYLTGRNEHARNATIEWLDGEDLPRGSLYMRDPQDWRKAEVFKEEVYRAKIEPHYDVVFVLEDYDPCVKMFRDLGLTVLQPRITNRIRYIHGDEIASSYDVPNWEDREDIWNSPETFNREMYDRDALIESALAMSRRLLPVHVITAEGRELLDNLRSKAATYREWMGERARREPR